MYKRIIGLSLAVVLIMSTPVASAEAVIDEEFQIFPMPLSEDVENALDSIPIFITYINVDNVTSLQATKENSLERIKEAISLEAPMSMASISNTIQASERSTICAEEEFEVVLIPNNEKAVMRSNPLFVNTFERIESTLDDGVIVNYVNFFLPDAFENIADNIPRTSAANNVNDPAYWESYCNLLGTYNGYKFLYLESAFNVESAWVTPGNLSGSWKWDAILQKVVKTVLNHYVKNSLYATVKATENVISTLLGSYTPALNITYSSSSGYLKSKVSGDIYTRTVLIRDDLDKVSGYAYYDWGTTERFVATLKFDAKYPISQNSAGTYNYITYVATGNTQYSNTPGFYGNATFYQSVINLYSNTVGYHTHDEFIDVSSIVAQLLS
jgi:hypothetical protein